MVVNTRSVASEFDPNDRWSEHRRRIHVTGIHATIRGVIDALRADVEAGRRTAAFVSGYQGSPLAGFDRELATALRSGLDVEIHHRPALNEEVAATSIMGTQIATTLPRRTHDGVLGVWYAKAPGFDRAMDALRHANYAGVSKTGGVLAVVGDDPDAKSSTLPSASDSGFVDLAMPFLYPSGLADVYGLVRHGVNLSRYCGSWVAFKIVTQVADAEGIVDLESSKRPIWPTGSTNTGANGALLTPESIEREIEVRVRRIEAAKRYADANRLNEILPASRESRLVLVAPGRLFTELRAALATLGLDERRARDAGVTLSKVSMPFPLGAAYIDALGRVVPRVVVVEERHAIIEHQLLSALSKGPYRSEVLGRLDALGRPLFPSAGAIGASTMARLLFPILRDTLDEGVVETPREHIRVNLSDGPLRVPWFCSGCPHSVSTVAPSGALVGEGIGCHSMVHYMPGGRTGDRIGLTQMGGEGAQWIGISPFVEDRHLFQNIGDGTFFHSGELALRAAVAAGVNITYKILWNGVTAMTGGQLIVGALASASELAELLLRDGVKKVVITTDDLGRYRRVRLARGVELRARNEINEVQVELSRIDGVTAMIHDQPCATELRRGRKRGLITQPRQRVVINERVCEGCGDCQVKSNCLSLSTVETPLGPKTQVDHDTCNLDRSCLAGDCPAFGLTATVDPAEVRLVEVALLGEAPVRRLERPWRIEIAGIGGTGVVTAAHLLSWAALNDGLAASGADQTGLSQKAGPVISDLVIADPSSTAIDEGSQRPVDLLVAADLVTATTQGVLTSLACDAHVVASSATPLTGPMVIGEQERDLGVPRLLALLKERASVVSLDAVHVARSVGASESAANIVLLGMASQLGLLPVRAASIEISLERAGIDSMRNIAAFRAGRYAVAHPDRVDDHVEPTERVNALIELLDLPLEVASTVAWFEADLIAYQDVRYGARFIRLVTAAADAARREGLDHRLAEAVAAGYHKLLAIKDEYEVARLLLDFPAAEGPVVWLLHPPLLRSLGLRSKIALGPWAKPVLSLLRVARALRSTPFDPFAHAPTRRRDRALVAQYERTIEGALHSLTTSNADTVVEMARLPSMIRGYEQVRAAAIDRYEVALEGLIAQLGFEAGDRI